LEHVEHLGSFTPCISSQQQGTEPHALATSTWQYGHHGFASAGRPAHCPVSKEVVDEHSRSLPAPRRALESRQLTDVVVRHRSNHPAHHRVRHRMRAWPQWALRGGWLFPRPASVDAARHPALCPVHPRSMGNIRQPPTAWHYVLHQRQSGRGPTSPRAGVPRRAAFQTTYHTWSARRRQGALFKSPQRLSRFDSGATAPALLCSLCALRCVKWDWFTWFSRDPDRPFRPAR
jgi:hypothetical protein